VIGADKEKADNSQAAAKIGHNIDNHRQGF
jgi:hypothetical protein